MNNTRTAGEKLLDAWMNLSSTVWNRRVVRTMTFNEICVCSLLKRRMEEAPEDNMTATDLCEKTRLFKSQMNKVLNTMEDKGFIKRTRSERDKRFVYIELCEKGLEQYELEHKEIMSIVNRLVDDIGEKRTEQTAEAVNEISETLRKFI